MPTRVMPTDRHYTSTGVPSLDTLFVGGYPEKSAILIEGASSNEKEALGYEFISSGLSQGDFCLYVTRLRRTEVLGDARALGVELDNETFWMSPEGGNRKYVPDDLAGISFQIKGVLKEHEGKRTRVVFDLLSNLLMANSSDSVHRFLAQLLVDLKRYEVTFVATIQEDMHPQQVLAGLELLFDGVLAVRRSSEAESEVRVKKMLGIKPTATSTSIMFGNTERGGASGPRRDRVAVLPLLNMSPDPNDAYFADGMTEELISSVSRTDGLRVIARTSVMKYKGANKTISEIGKELNVGSVLEGSVRKAGDKVRITIQLVDSSNEEPKWSQEYDRELRDIFAIQGDIANKVAEALRTQVLGAPAGAGGGVSPEAYVNYLRGRQAWNKRNKEGLNDAVTFFKKSLEVDRAYARALSGLADSYATLALLEFSAPNEVYPLAKEAVSRAVALDPGLAEAHSSLGLIRFQYDWDWGGAEAEFREAIRLNPSYAPAHHFFADYLKAMGRFGEALAEISKARELDPLSLAINTGVGHVLYLSRQYDQAIVQYKKAVDLDPSFMATHVWFGRPYLEKRMYAEAISELETAVKLSGESTLALAMLGHGLASAGRKDEALGILEKLRERAKTDYVPSYWVAVVYNGFRDRDQVMHWMKKAFEERSSWLVWSNVEPRFDWLRGDPEFSTLMEAMKFP